MLSLLAGYLLGLRLYIGDLPVELGLGDARGVPFKLRGIGGGRLMFVWGKRIFAVSASFGGLGDKFSCFGAGFYIGETLPN